MRTMHGLPSFKTSLSLEPLISFWQEQIAPACSHMAGLSASFQERIKEIPELQGTIDDVSILAKHEDLIMPLMSMVFPVSSWDKDVAGALIPYTFKACYFTPEFKRLLINQDGSLRVYHVKEQDSDPNHNRFLRACFLILERVYGLRMQMQLPVIAVVPDEDSGLERYYRIDPDLRFVSVKTIGPPPPLSKQDLRTISDNITDIERLAAFLPADKFEFQGFTVVRAVDVTESEVLSQLQKDLIDQDSIFSAEGFKRLEQRLRVLYGKPDMVAGMGTIQGDQALIINARSQTSTNCIFTNSMHIPLAELRGSVWLRAVEKGSDLRIRDLKEESDLTITEQRVLSMGIRSMLVSPLQYRGENVGTLQFMSPRPSDFGPMDGARLAQIAPLFSVALKRALDELEHKVQGIIKEKCTAVHPTVEWRFRRAAYQYMERLHSNQAAEMEPIVFKDVIPFFAQTDIRGSSEARNRAIQADLIEQLSLAEDIMKWAGEAAHWPLLPEIAYRINKRIEGLRAGLTSNDETAVKRFLKEDVEPVFEEIMGLGPRSTRAIKKYGDAVDPALGVVYRMRRQFEESVSMLTEGLSAYLEKEESLTQTLFAHYFEKHQTDGIDYIIYVGDSMSEKGRMKRFHIQNLGLWQLSLACGMARETERIKPSLKVPLDTCHLILVNRAPLSIRFRYDERRFDVDGAYDVRHEIIKSRIDKATVKGSRARLTQPGRVAVVFSNPEEGREMQRHIDYLRAKGEFLDDVEKLDLEDLPGVQGLKAFRVGVNVAASEATRPAQRAFGTNP